MRRFEQLISVLAALVLLLGCLGGTAAAEGATGSLTVTIDGNNQGVSTAGLRLYNCSRMLSIMDCWLMTR